MQRDYGVNESVSEYTYESEEEEVTDEDEEYSYVKDDEVGLKDS